MNNLQTRIFTTVGFSSLLLLTLQGSAIAQRGMVTQWRSKSEDLVITVVNKWGRSCASKSPQSIYRVKNGASGEVYPIDCDKPLRKKARSRFIDTEGVERCIGTTTFERVDSRGVTAAETIWNIDRAVPGFRCSTAGKSFKVKVFYFEAPLMSR